MPTSLLWPGACRAAQD